MVGGLSRAMVTQLPFSRGVAMDPPPGSPRGAPQATGVSDAWQQHQLVAKLLGPYDMRNRSWRDSDQFPSPDRVPTDTDEPAELSLIPSERDAPVSQRGSKPSPLKYHPILAGP